MKNIIKLFGIAVLVTALVFSFTACDDGNGGVSGGSLTITDLPSGKYLADIYLGGTDISTPTARNAAFNKRVASGSNDVGNVFTLQTQDTDPKIWTGSGSFEVYLQSNWLTGPQVFLYATVSFSNGIGTVQYSSFAAVAASDGLTIIGLPSGTTYNVFIFPSGTDISSLSARAAADDKAVASGVNINGGNVLQLVSESVGDWGKTWTGSGSFEVYLSSLHYATVSFSNGIGTANYSDFKPVEID